MSTQSRFVLAESRYVVFDNRLVCSLDIDYAEKIIEQILFVEKQYSFKEALLFIEKLNRYLPGRIFKPDDASVAMFNAMADSAVREAKLGTKVRCNKCNRKYYTKNDPAISCPLCLPPASAAALQTKQGE